MTEYDALLLQHVLWQRPEQADRIADWVVSQLSVDDGLKQVRVEISSGGRERSDGYPACRSQNGVWFGCSRVLGPELQTALLVYWVLFVRGWRLKA